MSFFTNAEARTLRTAEQIDVYVRRNLRWNMRAGIIDAMCFALASQILSNETVIPLLITSLGASAVVLGLVTAATNLGHLLPQLFMASLTEGLRFKKPISLVSGAFERASFFLIGLAVWAWGDTAPGVVLVMFVVLRFMGSMSIGAIIPAWSTMISKVIPTRKRGQFFGIGRSLGSAAGVGGGLLAGYILGSQPFPRNFALCLMLGSAVYFISWAGLAITREPPDLEVRARPRILGYLSRLPGLMRRDRNFRSFVLARTVAVLGTMATGFIAVYGAQRFALSGVVIGRLTATMAVVQTVMFLVWGATADRWGYKCVLCAGAVSTGMAALVAALTPGIGGLYLALGFVGAALAGETIAANNILLEFSEPANRPTYIGLGGTLLAPSRAAAPVIGGILATSAGYGSLFPVATAVSLAGALLLTFGVREPRVHGPMPAQADASLNAPPPAV